MTALRVGTENFLAPWFVSIADRRATHASFLGGLIAGFRTASKTEGVLICSMYDRSGSPLFRATWGHVFEATLGSFLFCVVR